MAHHARQCRLACIARKVRQPVATPPASPPSTASNSTVVGILGLCSYAYHSSVKGLIPVASINSSTNPGVCGRGLYRGSSFRFAYLNDSSIIAHSPLWLVRHRKHQNESVAAWCQGQNAFCVWCGNHTLKRDHSKRYYQPVVFLACSPLQVRR